jgi:hypothetical protein
MPSSYTPIITSNISTIVTQANISPPINVNVDNSVTARFRLPVVLNKIVRRVATVRSADLEYAETVSQNINNTFFNLKDDRFDFSNVLPDSESKNFFIAFEEESFAGDLYTNYYSITEVDTDFVEVESVGTPSNETVVYIDYDQSELDILENKYTTEPLSFLLEQVANFSFERGEGDTSNTRQSMIDYDSISSLGAISDETITISATTGSATGLITEQAETITDVGGLSGAGRGRTIEGGGVDGANVTTSGY